jgi:hypothetical protein
VEGVAMIDSERWAILSECGRYRYELGRLIPGLDRGRVLLFVMLNPSTADGEKDDPTVRRCIGFARREGCGTLLIVNLFAWRATLPSELVKAGPLAVGERNQDHVISAMQRAHIVIAGWGASGVPTTEQVQAVWDAARITHKRLSCLGVTGAGHPRHPLYLPGDAPVREWPMANGGHGWRS